MTNLPDLLAKAEAARAILQNLVDIRDWSHDYDHDARRAYDAVADNARDLLSTLQEIKGVGQ